MTTSLSEHNFGKSKTDIAAAHHAFNKLASGEHYERQTPSASDFHKDFSRGNSGGESTVYDINQPQVKVSSSPATPRSYFSESLASAGTTGMREESLAPETLQTAKELHKIPQQSVKVERDKLIADTKKTLDKEEILQGWQVALNQEKAVFQRESELKANKLAERECLAQIHERRLYEREQQLQVREQAMKEEVEREERIHETEQKLRRWEEILIKKGQDFIERENRYWDERAILVADERLLQDREAAMDEAQKAFDAKISDAIESLSVVQQARKRKERSDIGDLEWESKKQRTENGC
ncbi:hypothetical protein WAI453_008589 [Rhynchosporium graminicola]